MTSNDYKQLTYNILRGLIEDLKQEEGPNCQRGQDFGMAVEPLIEDSP